MPTPLDDDDAQRGVAGDLSNAQAIRNFAQAVRQATPAVQQFTTTVRTSSGGGGGLGAAAGSALGAAFRGGRTAFNALGAIAGQVGSPTSSFIERRLDWALFGAGTAGAGVLGSSLLASANAGQLSYSLNQGLSIGQVGANSITYKAAQAVFEKTGVDPFGVAAITGGERKAADITSEIARFGGKVTPGLRQAVLARSIDEEDRAIAERKLVNQAASAEVGRRQMLSATPGADPVPVLQETNNLLKQIHDAIMNKVGSILSGG